MVERVIYRLFLALTALSTPQKHDILGLPASPTLADAVRACPDLDDIPTSQIDVSLGTTIVSPMLWGTTPWPRDVPPLISVRPADPATITAAVITTFKAVAAFVATNPQLAAALVNAGFALLSKAFEPRAKKQRAAEQAYSIERAGNTARPGEPVPVLMGRRRIYPDLAAPYRRRVDGAGKLWLDVLLCPGLGQMDIEAPKLGDTPIANIDGLVMQAQTKTGDPAQTIYTQTCFAEYVGREFKEPSDGWHTTTLPDEVTTVEALLYFPAGLARIKSNSGTAVSTTVSFEVRVGPVGGTPDAAPTSFTLSRTAGTRDGFHYAQAFAVAQGRYAVHVRRTTARGGTDIIDAAILLQVAGFATAAPVRDASLPLIAVSIPASKVAEGSLASFNVIATTRARQVGASGAGAMIATHNPADLLASIPMGPFADRPLTDAQIDWPALAAFRAFCVARNYQCDLFEQSEVSGAELMTRIAACGRGRWVWRNGLLSVVWDGEKPNAVQLFTSRNVTRLSGRLVWPDPVHGLRLSFARADRDYATDEMEVFAAGYTAANATLFDTAEIRDQTDVDQVAKTGNRIMAEARERAETFVFETDGEIRAIKQLDRILLSHAGGLAGLGSARVVSVFGNVVTLDQPVRAPANQQLGLRVRRGAADFAAIAVTGFANETWTDTLTFDGAPSVTPQAGDLVGFGVRTLEAFDLMIDTIRPLQGGRFEVTCWPFNGVLAGSDPAALYRTFAIPMVGSGLNDDPDAVLRLELGASLSVTIAGLVAATSDGIYTPSEKRDRNPDLLSIIASAPTIIARATALGVTTESATFESTMSALNTLLAGLTAPVLWYDATDSTTIPDPITFASVAATAFQRRDELQAACDREAALQSTWTGTGGRPTNLTTLIGIEPINNDLVPVGDANLFRFADFEKGLAGWAVVPDTAFAVAPTVGSAEGNLYIFAEATNPTAAYKALTFITDRAILPVSIQGGRRVCIACEIQASGNVFYTLLRPRWFTAAGVETVGSGSASLTGAQPYGSKLAFFTTVPAGTVAMALDCFVVSQNVTGNFSLLITRPQVNNAGGTQTTPPPWSKGFAASDGADVTAQVAPRQEGPAALTFDVNSAGVVTPASQLPRTVQHKRWRGATDVSATATWSIVSPVGVTVGAISGGGYNITAVSASGGSYIVRSVFDGLTIDQLVTVGVNTVSVGGGGGVGNSGISNTGNAGSGWQTVLTVTVTGPAGLALFAGMLRPLTFSGDWTGRARLTIDGGVIETSDIQPVSIGGVEQASDFSGIFQVSASVASGQRTYRVQMERTSGTGSINSTDTQLAVTVTPISA